MSLDILIFVFKKSSYWFPALQNVHSKLKSFSMIILNVFSGVSLVESFVHKEKFGIKLALV